MGGPCFGYWRQEELQGQGRHAAVHGEGAQVVVALEHAVQEQLSSIKVSKTLHHRPAIFQPN